MAQGIITTYGGGWCSSGGPSASHHTYTRTQPHVTAGGGRGSLSTLSGKEATDAKQVLGLTTKDWGIVVAVGTIVGTITGSMTLMMHVMERVHQSEVALIKAEAAAAQARIKAEAKADAARLQDKAEFYNYYVQALGTRDHEPLEEAMSRRHKENKERAQAMMAGESAGKEGK